MKKRHIAAIAAAALSVAAAAVVCFPPRLTTHAVEPSPIGDARATSDLEAVVDEPGPVTVETVVGADWEVDRAGLINLKHPKAIAAGLADGPEPVQISFHALRHPTRGLFVIDTGVERAFRDDPEHALMHGIAGKAMHVEKMVVRTDTASWIAKQSEPVAGVFLTHMHADHLSGMRDMPSSAIVYTGPGESAHASVENLVVRPITDAALAGKGPIREWRFVADPDGVFNGVIDVFGDKTVWALHVPGHTEGSTAYVARTPSGPVLFVGDACHTAWGWENGVEPGTFSGDVPRSVESLARLERFAKRHPRMEVRLGHQPLPRPATSGAKQAAR